MSSGVQETFSWMACCASDIGQATTWAFPPSRAGRGRFSISAVCTSANCRNICCSSGRLTNFENRVFAKYNAVHGQPFIDVARYMPYDPNLFSDGIHNTPPGIKLRAWIEMQQLVPIVEKHLADGSWPRTVPPMPEQHPAFTVPPRLIKFTCPAS